MKHDKKNKSAVNYRNEVKWSKLDNSAHLFPVIAGEGLSNVYRISVTLFEEIDKDILQEALGKVLPYFSVFKCRMRKGVFWYYFEENVKKPPKVTIEKSYPCQYIDASKNRSYLFRVTYYKTRINLEVFHSLTDGTGAFAFLKELTYQYLRLTHAELAEKFKDELSSGTSLNIEDSYLKNCGETRFHSSYSREKAYLLKGREFENGEMGIITGRMDLGDVKRVSKSYEATINEFITALFLYSIYEECINKRALKVPISASIPVNLRPYFNSVTSKNFFVMISASFHPVKADMTFEEVLSEIKISLRNQLTKDHLTDVISYNVTGETAMIIRAVPLFIKKIALKYIYSKTARANTVTITNMGNIKTVEGYDNYIKGFDVLLSKSKGQPLKMSLVSYQQTLSATITSTLRDPGIQKTFFSNLVKMGINVAIESNGVYYE